MTSIVSRFQLNWHSVTRVEQGQTHTWFHGYLCAWLYKALDWHRVSDKATKRVGLWLKHYRQLSIWTSVIWPRQLAVDP